MVTKKSIGNVLDKLKDIKPIFLAEDRTFYFVTSLNPYMFTGEIPYFLKF